MTLSSWNRAVVGLNAFVHLSAVPGTVAAAEGPEPGMLSGASPPPNLRAAFGWEGGSHLRAGQIYSRDPHPSPGLSQHGGSGLDESTGVFSTSHPQLWIPEPRFGFRCHLNQVQKTPTPPPPPPPRCSNSDLKVRVALALFLAGDFFR